VPRALNQITYISVQNPEKIKGVYKHYLLKQVEAVDADIYNIKKLTIKLEREIQQLQKNASRTVIFKTMTHTNKAYLPPILRLHGQLGNT